MRSRPNFLAQMAGPLPQLLWGIEVQLPGTIIIHHVHISDVKKLFRVVEQLRKQHPRAVVKVVADTYEEAS